MRLSAPLAAVLALLLGACASAPPPPEAPAGGAQVEERRIPALRLVRPPTPQQDEDAEPALRIRLQEAVGLGDPPTRPPVTDGTWPLPPAEAERLLARLPPLPEGERKDLSLPPESPAPPPRGETIEGPRPAAGEAPAADHAATQARSVEVIRIAPEGKVGPVPHVTIVFNQAMVALTSVAEADREVIPVRLDPEPAGRWRWLNPRTLRFEPEERLPMATRFRLELPAGARSATGQMLERAVAHEFTTSAPAAIGGHPHEESTGLQPLFLLVFDQAVDPASVAARSVVRVGEGRHPVRLATPDEIEADTVLRHQVPAAPEARSVVLMPRRALPPGAEARLVVERGTPSLEGSGVTDVGQYLPFETAAPLRLRDHQCGDLRLPCQPGDRWFLAFNNRIDPGFWREDLVRVRPEVEDLTVRITQTGLTLQGRTRAHTTYTVRLDPAIRDVHGYSLGGAQEIRFAVEDHSVNPELAIAGSPHVVLDPASGPELRVHTRAVDRFLARVYRVTPEDWVSYADALREQPIRGDPEPITPPGTLIDSAVVRASGAGFGETGLDLSGVLRNGLGQLFVLLDPVQPPAADPTDELDAQVYAWVQATRIGLSAMVGPAAVQARATSLETGEPLAGVSLQLHPSGNSAVTDADGLASIPLAGEPDPVLIARHGEDIALLTHPVRRWGGTGWERRDLDRLYWSVFSDRRLYRPGERVSLKGWVRLGEVDGDVRLASEVEGVEYTLTGPRSEEIAEGGLPLTRLGGFQTTAELPREMNLGFAYFRLAPTGDDLAGLDGSRLGISVQEYRRPEYEVFVEAGDGPHIVRGTATARTVATYYGGGALADAELEWRVRTSSASYAPPGWQGWSFGGAPIFQWGARYVSSTRRMTAATDESGEHRLEIDLLSAEPPFPNNVRAEVRVADLDLSVGSGAAVLLVHPASVYAGMRTERSWVRPGQPVAVEIAVVDLDGDTASGRPVRVTAERMEWRSAPSRRGWEVVEETELCAHTSSAEVLSCTFTPARSGTIRLTAEVTDREGRASRTERHLWIAGDAALPPPGGRSGEERLGLLPDRESYAPGDTAEVLIQAPFHPAHATLTLRRGGITHTETFVMEGPSRTIPVPIDEAHTPAVRVHVEMVERGRGIRRVSGEAKLEVSPDSRELGVTVVPRDSVVEPGGTTEIEVEVRRRDGTPAAGAEVALWMVDEAILAMGRYRMPDPLSTFHPDRHSQVRDHTVHEEVLPALLSAGPGTVSGIIRRRDDGGPLVGTTVRIPDLDLEAVTDATGAFTIREVPEGEHTLRIEAPRAAPAEVVVEVPAGGVHLGTYFMTVRSAGGIMYARDQPAEMPAPPPAERGIPPSAVAPPPPPGGEGIAVRADFTPLALFEPALTTDSRGRVRISATLPGTITRYRVMVVAVEGAARAGRAEEIVTARRDLTVRALPPRFLNFGDRAELPVLVQNLTDGPVEADVALRGTALRLDDGAGRRVVVPAGGRVEVRFPATAVEAGTAHLQAVAASGGRTDATAVEFPVYTPATAESFAAYGEVDGDRAVVLPVRMPPGVVEQFGGVEATVSSTALQALTDAVLFLKNHPFDGTEQVASRVLAVATLRDALGVFESAELPPPDEIEAAMVRDLRDLASAQRRNGGWALWGGREDAHPYVSIHAANALERARRGGYDVDARAVERAHGFLRDIDEHIPESYGPAARRSLNAYALYVRQRLGDEEAADLAARQAMDPTRLPLAAAGWLLHVLAEAGGHPGAVDELVRTIRNRVEETAATATFTTRQSDREHLLMHSDRCSHAVVLEALIAADPRSDIIPKAARGLLAHRVRGRWSTTVENAWALAALERYFATYEGTAPDFRVGAWLGERYAGSHEFVGRSAERFHLEIPTSELAREGGDANLLLHREGDGRMYYRAAIRYAPADLELEAEDRGFLVERSYEAVDDEGDVRRAADGTWHIRAGARVRVRVTMTAPGRRHHVALVDPLPAGLEPLNPALAGTGFTDDPGRREAGAQGWWGRWFGHQNLRDDRAEAFATILPAGVYEYVYQAQASTPGSFIVPPARAEELYHPETFGRGATSRVVIQ